MPTPALLVDYPRLVRNVREMSERASRHGVALWPHAKTHKSPAIAALQRQHGAAGITVATVAEAECFARHGFEDILVAYPPVGAWRIDRLIRLAARARIRVVVDDPGVLRSLERACRQAGVMVEFLWEIDCGTRRLGRAPGRPSAELIAQSEPSRWVRFGGLMTFAGHVYGAATQAEVRTIAVGEAAAVRSTAEVLARRGIKTNALSTGTTPTAHHLECQQGVTEIRPGNYVFYDATQVALGVADRDRCALSVMATVIGRPDPHRIVLDAGSKALAAERMTPKTPGFGFVIDHEDLTVERLYEEHAIVVSTEPSPIPVGTRLRVVPNHACAATNLHQSLFVVDGGDVAALWPVGASADGARI